MSKVEILAALTALLAAVYVFVKAILRDDPVVPPPVSVPVPIPVPDPVPPPPAPKLRVAQVSYFFPGPKWALLETCVPTVAIALINPASGPGKTSSAAYAAQLASSKSKGIRVFGYLTLNYMDLHGAQGDGVDRLTTAGPKSEIDKYVAFYPGLLAGVFLDEQDNSGTAASVAYSSELYAYAKSKGLDVIINPGTRCAEIYLACADIIMNFEGSVASYRTRTPAAYEASYPPNRFWHCVHDVTAADMPEMVALCKSRTAGYLHLGEATYGNLPVYFADFVGLVGA